MATDFIRRLAESYGSEMELTAIRDAVDAAFRPVKLRRDPIANVMDFLDVNNISVHALWERLDQDDIDGIAAAVLEARPHCWAEEDLSEVSDYLRMTLEGSPEERIDKQALLLMAIKAAAEKAAESHFEVAQSKRLAR